MSHFARFLVLILEASNPYGEPGQVQSDVELVKACLNGEKKAFAVLVKRYERPARAAALDVLRDYHCADDATQDAFIAAYNKLPELRKASAFGPWLMKITRRCALDVLRQKHKETSLETVSVSAIEKE